MVVPGSNLLLRAAKLIAQQPVTHYAFAARVTNAAGYDEATYAPGVVVPGSFQPMDRTSNAAMGLDISKDYARFYTARAVLGLNRDVSGDQFGYKGRRWQVEGVTDWSSQDGWCNALLVDVGPDAG